MFSPKYNAKTVDMVKELIIAHLSPKLTFKVSVCIHGLKSSHAQFNTKYVERDVPGGASLQPGARVAVFTDLVQNEAWLCGTLMSSSVRAP